MEIQIIPMRMRHVFEAAQIELACFSDPWSEASFVSELENPISLWLAAEVDGVLAGYAGSQTVFEDADIMNVAVAEPFRRQGIGQALMEAMCDALRQRGVETVALEVRKSNAPAIALYEKMGFTLAGVRPNYYFKPREDALILKKKLETL